MALASEAPPREHLAMFQKQLAEEEIRAIVHALEGDGAIAVKDKKVSYSLS